MVWNNGLGAAFQQAPSLGQLSNLDVFALKLQEESIKNLMAFKASERKNDPQRRHGIHGPYEEATVQKTGRLPADYYTPGDPEPWGLRVAESRSGIMWQVLSGIMDNHAEFGTVYMSIALDTALSDDDYAKELRGINKSWGDYLLKNLAFNDHQHSAMASTYHRVSCPNCSMLTALAAQDKGMQSLFKEMLALHTATERRAFLSEKGLMPLMDIMIPDQKPELKL